MYSLAVGGVLKAEDITEYVPWHQELKEALYVGCFTFKYLNF